MVSSEVSWSYDSTHKAKEQITGKFQGRDVRVSAEHDNPPLSRSELTKEQACHNQRYQR